MMNRIVLRIPLVPLVVGCFTLANAATPDQQPREVVQTITVTDSSDGTVLDKERKVMPQLTFSGNRIEDCRIEAVARAKGVLVPFYRGTHPYAFANVVCHWQDPTGQVT